jgi:hypothetical protein
MIESDQNLQTMHCRDQADLSTICQYFADVEEKAAYVM